MRPESRLLVRGVVAGLLAVVAFAVAWFALLRQGPDPAQVTAAPDPVRVDVQPLFEKWPQDRKPDLVIVLSGQTYGYLQKCGCSNPQKGGLERRYNFIESLKARGWEVIGLDVGDVPRPLPYTPTSLQTLAKYETAMQAMKLMGYKATTVGKEELAVPLLDALSKYSLQKGNEYPKVHAANIANRQAFPGADGGSSLTESDVIATRGGVSVGVIGVAGLEVTSQQIDRTVKFAGQAGPIVGGILQTWKAGKAPDVNVLLYQGPFDWTDPATGQQVDAKTASKAFPQFHVVVCKTPDDAEAPDMPHVMTHKDPKTGAESSTMICQVGQKGQNVGVVGVFKGPKGTELYYQRVVMSPEFETPPAQEKGHPVLKLLQDYSDSVRDNDYLSEMAKRKKPHAVTLLPKHDKAVYAGDAECKQCHAAEWAHYQTTKHAHAYDALAKVARNPTGRNFDGECIICHTVGYEYKTGYVNENQTKHLKNVQCESCHGPASLHVAEETKNAAKKRGQTHDYLAALSPWKVSGQGAMPSLDKLAAMVKEKDHVKKEAMLGEAEQRAFLGVYKTCYHCHDLDNDPKFDLAAYWPKVVHSGLKKK